MLNLKNKLALLLLIGPLIACNGGVESSDETGGGGSFQTGKAGAPAGSTGIGGSLGAAGSSAPGRGGADVMGKGGSGNMAGIPGRGGMGGGSAGSFAGSSGVAGSSSGVAGTSAGRGGAAGAVFPTGVAGTTGAAGFFTGGAMGFAGTVGSAGSWGSSGGSGGGGQLGCYYNDVQCGPTGHRQRCGLSGTWVDESFVCTVQLSGSTDYRNVCALKADGTLSCWGIGTDFEQKQAALWTNAAPKKSWVEVSVGDGQWQSCAIDIDGVVSCWMANANGNAQFHPTGTFKHYVTTIYGDCGIRTTGELACFNGTTLPAADYAGRYTQLAVANQMVFAIDDSGALHKPSFASFPDGRYRFVAANNGAACALQENGYVYCFGPAQDVVTTPGWGPFVEVALDYNYRSACGLREDGTINCWSGRESGGGYQANPTGQFTHITSFQTGYCAIRRDGTTACWGDNMIVPQGW